MKFLNILRIIELFNGMFTLDYALSICAWDTEHHKQDVNNHAN